MHEDDPYPAAPEPSADERRPIVLDPYDDDLADLLALVRACERDDTAAVETLLALTSGRTGRILVTAVKLLCEISSDARKACASPAGMRQLAAELLDGADELERAGSEDEQGAARRFDADFAERAAMLVSRP